MIVQYDPDWGRLGLNSGDVYLGSVEDLGFIAYRIFTINLNKYGVGEGSGNLRIRGSTSLFLWNDVLPSWETYSGPITRGWRYVQVRADK